MKKYLIIFEKTRTGYSVYVPDLPGCIATGKNKDTAENNIYEAIKFHLEGLLNENLIIPEGRTEAGTIFLSF
ncbi:MAG: type II toxin-antitoxin system HicB family antitoxin [Bacteroidetes bacterium]|nr:type II toxin-antitoxin system HicB family antitoxin [Bacteroidota bacterium]